jgi:hypothetical protein
VGSSEWCGGWLLTLGVSAGFAALVVDLWDSRLVGSCLDLDASREET